MAAFSIRLLPGGWELVWHGVDYDVLRPLVTDGALADDDGLLYVTERGSASLSDYLAGQVTAEELPELEAFADEFDEFDLEVKAALTAWQQAARAQDDEAQMAAVERWLDVDSRLREAANRSEGASRHFGRCLARLEAARELALDGDVDQLTGHDDSSYHSVWFLLHETLLRSLRRERTGG